MKRCILSLAMVVIVALSTSAQAIDPRQIYNQPRLRFDGTTAYCLADCKGDSSGDKVEATLTLYQGNIYVDSWSDSGKGWATPSGNCSVESGKSYKLVLTYSVNGDTKPDVTTVAICP